MHTLERKSQAQVVTNRSCRARSCRKASHFDLQPVTDFITRFIEIARTFSSTDPSHLCARINLRVSCNIFLPLKKYFFNFVFLWRKIIIVCR